MATALDLTPATAKATASSSILCASCRALLPGVSPREDGGGEEGGRAPSSSDVIPVSEDPETGDLPEWIGVRVEEGGWTRGRLLCPQCGARVGGFDFVQGREAPVYLVASRVDVRTKVAVEELVKESRERNRNGQEEEAAADAQTGELAIVVLL